MRRSNQAILRNFCSTAVGSGRNSEFLFPRRAAAVGFSNFFCYFTSNYNLSMTCGGTRVRGQSFSLEFFPSRSLSLATVKPKLLRVVPRQPLLPNPRLLRHTPIQSKRAAAAAAAGCARARALIFVPGTPGDEMLGALCHRRPPPSPAASGGLLPEPSLDLGYWRRPRRGTEPLGCGSSSCTDGRLQ
jgi:hypothetical protein